MRIHLGPYVTQGTYLLATGNKSSAVKIATLCVFNYLDLPKTFLCDYFFGHMISLPNQFTNYLLTCTYGNFLKKDCRNGIGGGRIGFPGGSGRDPRRSNRK
jgi:hypothetical protein